MAEAPSADPVLLAPATAPASGPGQAVTASEAPGLAPVLAAASQASQNSTHPAHVPVIVIAVPIAGGVILMLLLAFVALYRAGLVRKARQTAPEPSHEDRGPGWPGRRCWDRLSLCPTTLSLH